MNNMFSKIFMWLSLGLLLSFGVGFYVSTNENLIEIIFSKYFFLLFIVELIIAFVLSLCIRKLSKEMTTVLYLAYSAVTGLTLSSVFIAYELYSVIYVFLATAFIFIALAIYGYKTKKDITKLGPILFFGLIGVVIITLINLLLIKSSNLDIIVTIVSMLIFVGFIAYDIHILKRNLYDIEEDKLVIYGAFQLYLDFINLFLDLLRLFGSSKD